MKFADKYEILEMVTSGRVSTFLARERASQEAVVVYTFECAGAGAEELSTASIISRFCALAPNPPGIIVKAGFDELSSSAFITTKMPDAVALKAWVGAYQSFGGAKPGAAAASEKPASSPAEDETAELSASEVRAMLAKSGPPPKAPPVENLSEDMGGVTAAFSLDIPATAAPKSAGEFTRLFNEVNAFQPVQSKAPAAPASPKASNATDAMFGELLGGSPLGGKPAPPVPPRHTPAPVEPSPGSFTREFMGLSGDNAAPVERQAPPAPRVPAPTEKEPGAFTREFMAVSQHDFQSGPPIKPVAPAQKPSSSPPPPATSFESIFGPSTPAVSPGGGGQTGNQKAGAGEFTSFFRDPFESPGAPQKPIVVPDVASSSPAKPPVGDFTRMFGRDDMSRGEPGPLPPSEPEPPASAGSFTQMFGESPSGKKTQGSQLGGATLGTDPNVRPTFLEPAGAPPARPASPRGGMTPTPVPPPVDPFFSRTPPPVAPPVGQPFMNRAGSIEATDVFRMPGGGDAPPIDEGPRGPSEFTQFLSRSQVNAAMGPEPVAPAVLPPAPQPSPFQFAPPPAPAPPAMKFPSAPAVPAAPPAPAAAPKLASFWPLILVLTVLFAIGAMLVMYFALKH